MPPPPPLSWQALLDVLHKGAPSGAFPDVFDRIDLAPHIRAHLDREDAQLASTPAGPVTHEAHALPDGGLVVILRGPRRMTAFRVSPIDWRWAEEGPR